MATAQPPPLQSNESIWRTCLENFDDDPDFPAPPPDMSPPAFINLAFSLHCHGCGEDADWAPVDWDLRVRFCDGCSREYVVLFDDANPPRMPSAPPTVRLRDLILTRPPAFECAYLARDFVSMRAHLRTLDADAKTAFCTARKAALQDARIHARTCRDWGANIAIAQKSLSDAIKAERELEIRARFLSLGWDDALTILPLGESAISRWPLVDKAQPLTEKIWDAISLELKVLWHHACTKARAEEAQAQARRLALEEKMRILRLQAAEPVISERKRAKKEAKRLQAKRRAER